MSWKSVLAVALLALSSSGAPVPLVAFEEEPALEAAQTEALSGHGVRTVVREGSEWILGSDETDALLGVPGTTWPCPTTDLDAAYTCLKGRMSGLGARGYHAPSSTEFQAWVGLLEDLLASSDCSATIPSLLVDVVDFVRLDSTGADADVCVLAEVGDRDGDGVSDRGWGGVALRLGAASSIHVQAPHVQYDVQTGEQAIGVFRLVDAVRSVSWAGSHRYTNTPTSGPDGSDMSEALGSIFMASLEALLGEADDDAAFLSIHGMRDESCQSDVFLTTGQARIASAGEPVLNLRDELRSAYSGAGITATISAYEDEPGCSLTGGNNVQGMRIRSAGRTFIHMESEGGFIERTHTSTAVAAADLNDALGTRNPAWPCPTQSLSVAYSCLKSRMGQTGSLAYQIPDAAQRENWTALADSIFTTNSCARSQVPLLLQGAVELTRLDSGGSDGDLCVVAEVQDLDLDGRSDLGWGGYAVNLTGTRDVHLNVPYPFYHTESGEHATDLFAALPGGRSVAWAGAHRYAMPDLAVPGEFASDAAVRTDTMLAATLEASLTDSTADGVFLNLQVFADGACPDSPIYLTPANGTVPPSNGPTAALRDALDSQFQTIQATMYGDPDACSLGEMRVAQSGPVSAAGRTFILALTEGAYQDGAKWADAVDLANLGE